MDYDFPVGDKLEMTTTAEHYDEESIRLSYMVPFAGTPKHVRPQPFSETLHTTVRVEGFKNRSNIVQRNVWLSVSRYMVLDGLVQGKSSGYYAYSLIVRLRFSGRLIVEEPSDCSITRSGKDEECPRIPGSISSTRTFPLFNRSWVDETQDFSMCAVRSTLRDPSFPVKDLGANYTWYIDAVPVDALFPPGIPLSAKEILAYYPHHIRWRDVMLRLAKNDYRGGDIIGIQAFFRGAPSHPTSAAAINTYQRDALRTLLPGFRTDTFNTKHDRSLHTLHLSPGKYILDKRNGFTIPTLDDLTRGLHHLAAGLDARCLTECLDWYLSWRDAFTPPLQLNVLHVQALSRALRIPLRPFGPQNLDVNALAEWKGKGGRFEERHVSHHAPVKSTVNNLSKDADAEARKTRIEIHLNSERVTLHLQFPIRHVLTFPFLALHGVVGEAVKMGIAKAEMRRMEREDTE